MLPVTPVRFFFGDISWFVRLSRRLVLVTLLLTLVGSALAASDKQLSARYKEWLNKDVVYIITQEEREAFLQLTSDEARDANIERFWAIRNPTPGAPSNPYKEEHYRRLEFASQSFGHNGNGWRTAMGRVYITLGKPEQRGLYHGLANVRPLEIWFYQNVNPALPPYFSVLFYQRDAGDDFRLYSPYMDGPNKLANTLDAVNDRQAAFKIIDTAAGREVARTTLSLLPGEPVDIDGATSSMASDVLLQTINGLANHPFNKDLLNERRRLLESVTHRVIVSGEYIDVLSMPLIDRLGNTNLHYLLRLRRPEDFTLTKTKDGRYYYSADVSVRVLTTDRKEIFTQERKLSEYLTAQQMESVKRKVFGYEGVLPLPPGQYVIDCMFTNTQTQMALHAEKQIEIPEPGGHQLWLTPLVAFSEVKPLQQGEESVTPFLAAGLKFTPVPKEPMELVVGQQMQFFYQMWTTPSDAKQAGDSKLQVEISYGRLSLHDVKTITDEVARSQFDSHGTMVNGKVVPTLDLPAGNYRVTVAVTDPNTHERAFSNMNVRLVPNSESPEAWDVTAPEAAQDAQQGVLEYQRAMAYLAQGKSKEALPWLKAAFDKNPRQEQVRTRLVDVLFSSQAFAQVASLYRRAGVTEHTDERTVLAMAESLEKIGALDDSVRLLESAVALQPSSGPLHLALAGYYQRHGDTEKAGEMERKAKSLMGAAHT